MDFGWSAEQQALHERMRSVGEEASAAEAAGRLEVLARAGVLGLGLPAAHGGGGHSLLDCAYAFEGLGATLDDGGLLLVAGAHLFGVGVCLARVGSEEQRDRWLPAMASGARVATIAATEVDAGSDVSAVACRVVGEEEVTVTGDKAWVTHAAEAGLFLVLGRGEQERGLSVALVPAGDGVTVGSAIATRGLRGAGLAPVTFAGARGERLGKAGAGMAVFQTAMVLERALVLAFRVGALERALKETVAFVRGRKLGGKPLADHQAVSHRVARMKLRLETARMLGYRAAWTLDQGKRGHLEAALAKWHVADVAVTNALDELRLRGGSGYRDDVPSTLDDALGGAIHSGTEDVLANIVAGWLGL